MLFLRNSQEAQEDKIGGIRTRRDEAGMDHVKLIVEMSKAPSVLSNSLALILADTTEDNVPAVIQKLTVLTQKTRRLMKRCSMKRERSNSLDFWIGARLTDAYDLTM